MPTHDISLELPRTAPRARALPQILSALRACLLVIVFAMTWAVPLSEMLAINLFRVAVILWLLQVGTRKDLVHSRVFLPLLCFLAITAIASLVAEDRVASWQQMKMMELGFAAVIVADMVSGLRQLASLVGGLIATACIVAVIAIWEVASGSMLRAQALSRHYVDFGEMMLLLALLSFGLLVVSWRKVPNSVRFGFGLAFLLLTAAVAATATRTFLASLIFGCALIVWTRFRWKARLWALAALALAIIMGGLWLHSRRGMSWFDSADPGTQYRFLIWEDGARIIREHPLLGVGFSNVQRHPERFDMAAYRAYPEMISHFHSTPIEIAADCGLPAFAIWCWLMLSCLVTANRALQQSTGWFPAGTAVGVIGAVAAFQFASLVHYVAGDPQPMLIFWSLIAFAIILENAGDRRPQEEKVP